MYLTNIKFIIIIIASFKENNKKKFFLDILILKLYFYVEVTNKL